MHYDEQTQLKYKAGNESHPFDLGDLVGDLDDDGFLPWPSLEHPGRLYDRWRDLLSRFNLLVAVHFSGATIGLDGPVRRRMVLKGATALVFDSADESSAHFTLKWRRTWVSHQVVAGPGNSTHTLSTGPMPTKPDSR